MDIYHVWCDLKPGTSDLEFKGLAPLDDAFTHVASRSGPVESFHQAVNSRVINVNFALYRDFPDVQRKTGEEKF